MCWTQSVEQSQVSGSLLLSEQGPWPLATKRGSCTSHTGGASACPHSATSSPLNWCRQRMCRTQSVEQPQVLSRPTLPEQGPWPLATRRGSCTSRTGASACPLRASTSPLKGCKACAGPKVSSSVKCQAVSCYLNRAPGPWQPHEGHAPAHRRRCMPTQRIPSPLKRCRKSDALISKCRATSTIEQNYAI